MTAYALTMDSKSENAANIPSTDSYRAAPKEFLIGSEDTTSQDALDMRRLGNTQELKRNFHALAVLGVTSIIVETWAGILINLPYSLINGGRAGSVWAFFGTWVLQFPMVASLAEMASMAPTAAGQYGWISEFAPSSIQKPLSYIAGWLAALGWQSFIAANAYGVAGIITTMASVGQPSYTPELWHVTLLMMGVGGVAICFNIFAAKGLPLFEGVMLICYVFGFFIVLIPLWVLAPKITTQEVFTKFENFGGWSSLGSACVIAQSAAASAFFGFDAAAHISEEVKTASVVVPRMMMSALLLNGSLGFVMVITFCFVVKDIPTQIIGSDSAFPWIGVFATATNSTAWALGMASILMLIAFSACINSVMAGSRQIWSLARDDGLPYPGFFTKLVKIQSTPVPLHSMLVSVVLLVILALVNLGGSKIINIIIGLGGGAIGSSYIISISCVLWRRLFSTKPLPPAKWSLGRFGPAINIIAIGYQTMATTIGFFPVYNHTDAQGMNWSIAVCGAVAILCTVNYILTGRRNYKGPVARILKED